MPSLAAAELEREMTHHPERFSFMENGQTTILVWHRPPHPREWVCLGGNASETFVEFISNDETMCSCRLKDGRLIRVRLEQLSGVIAEIRLHPPLIYAASLICAFVCG
jgi:hypothetical protein